ncbi:MAG: molybdopterin oxidoreductase family protein [Acidimicrobiales bacterium]|nr:molybdopterin oxidoreductase family protein [Acidimicrobiales bacterium]
MTVVDETSAASRVAIRTCPLCEAGCGLEIQVSGEQVVRIRGDRDDVFSHGYLCPKGSSLKQLHEDPDRLRAPLVKRDGVFVEVTWDEAFAEVERRLLPVLEQHGRDAVATYLGNPGAHNLSAMLFNRVLLKALGTRQRYSASTVDQRPKELSSGFLFGTGGTIPVPDLDRTDHLLVLGANPYASNGSICTAPDFPGRLEALRARGGRLVVVDPRRSRTAEEADEWVAIRPGTDALLLMGIVHALFEQDLVRLGGAEGLVEGLEQVRDVAKRFPAEVVAPACGIESDTVGRLARELVEAPTAAVYGRIGTCTQEFGTLASWLVDVVNILTGNLDRPGGAMFNLPAAGSATTRGKPGTGKPFVVGRSHTRVRGLPETLGEYPVAALAEEIDTPGEGRIRALVTVAGNPVLSCPNSGRLDAALATLECMVSVDIYLNETTRHADVILPPPSSLQRSHYDLALLAFAVRNVANYSPPVFPLEPGQPDEWEILARLALIAQGQGAAADPALVDDLTIAGMVQGAVSDPYSPVHGRSADELLAALAGRRGPDRILDLMLRTGPYGDAFGVVPDGLSLDVLEANPHGVDLGPLAPRLPEVLRTPSGRIELARPELIDDCDRLAEAAERAGDGFVLVGRRHLRSNNSWMHNLHVLVKGKERCTLQIHPDDAGRLGLTDGASALVASRVGQVVAPVEVTDGILPGVVSLPHGWGHDLDGVRLGVASGRPGVNSNLLADDELIDALSGNAVLNGIPVTVAPA